MNGPAHLTLSSNLEYKLEHFDTKFVDKDSTLKMLFIIGEEQINDIQSYDIQKISLIMNIAHS